MSYVQPLLLYTRGWLSSVTMSHSQCLSYSVWVPVLLFSLLGRVMLVCRALEARGKAFSLATMVLGLGALDPSLVLLGGIVRLTLPVHHRLLLEVKTKR